MSVIAEHIRRLLKASWKIGVITFLLPKLAFAQEGGGTFDAITDIAGWLTMPLTWPLAKLAEFIFWLVGFFTTLAASLMNWSVEFFVLQMPELIEEMDAINTVWAVLRDVGNLVFIFLILFAAISIILDNDSFSVKKILPKVLVVALLVNFSLFFTQVVIDTSNVLALQIYENISTPGGGQPNLEDVIASQLNLSSLNAEPNWSQIATEGDVYAKLAIARLFGAVMNFLVGFVMITIAALLGIRFLVLVLLMVASPIAFVAFALPSIDFGEDWWDRLLSESFFAPVLMLMLYITFFISQNLKESLGLSTNDQLMQAIMEPSGNVDIIAFFGLVIGLLIASLIVARQIGATGADKAVSYGKSISDWGQAKIKKGTGMAARGAVGYTGRKIDENIFKGSRIAKKYWGNKIREGTTGKMKNASFGTGTSYENVRKEKKKAKRDVESYDRKEKAKKEFEREGATKGQKRRALKELSAKERAEFIKSKPKERAQFASQSDIDKLESDDDFSEEDVRKVKQHRYNLTDKKGKSMGYKPSEILEAVRNEDSDTIENIEKTIKNNLEFVSNNEIKENVNLDLEADQDTEAGAVRRMTIQAMNASQIESLMKNKTSSERETIKKDVSDILDRKSASGDIANFLGGMDEKNIAKYLKNANTSTRERDEVIEQIDEKVLSELQGELSSGDQESLRKAILDRATRPGTTTTAKNRRAAEHLEHGPGAAI